MRRPTEFPGWERAVDDPFEAHASKWRARGYHPALAAVLAGIDVDHDAPLPLPLSAEPTPRRSRMPNGNTWARSVARRKGAA